MAAKNPAAAKAAKQKKMLIVLGVLMVAVAAFQVPKLMGGSSSTAAPETTAATDGSVAPVTPVAGAPVAAAAAPADLLPSEVDKTAPTAMLGGVEITGGKLVRASQGQLASFSLFKPKDPFKPGVVEKSLDADATVGVKAGDKATLGSGAKGPEPTAAKGGDSADGGVTTGSAGGDAGTSVAPTTVKPTVTTPEKPATTPVTPVETPVTTPEVPVVEEQYAFATLSVNGVAESVEITGQFPAVEPLFVLAAVKKGEAEIGIANGKLEKGKTVKLTVGKSLTLVDAASGVTYVVKLLTVGSQPDVTFTQGATAPEIGRAHV